MKLCHIGAVKLAPWNDSFQKPGVSAKGAAEELAATLRQNILPMVHRDNPVSISGTIILLSRGLNKPTERIAMENPVHLHPLEQWRGQIVVLDTPGPLVYIGTLTDIHAEVLILQVTGIACFSPP